MEKFGLTVLGLMILGFACDPASSQHCYPGWYLMNNTCYGVGGDVLSWSESQEFCEMYGANLVEINSKAENDFVVTLARKTNSPSVVWIGATDIFFEGNFAWIGSKNSIAGYTNWLAGQPDHWGSNDGEDCVELYGLSNPAGQWMDRICTQPRNFICEAEPLLKVPVGRK